MLAEGIAPVNDARGTDPRAVRPQISRLATVLLLAAAGGALFFWRLGSHDLWPPDEPRFGLVAKEMRERADFVVLSRNGRLYTDKPPLFFWAINGFGLLRGSVDEWAARLPSALAGVLALFLIARLGEDLYDRKTGILAALVFATSAEILVRARWASIDMTLNLFVLAATVLLWRAWTRPESSRAAARLSWAAMGLATLAKGPVGLALPLLAVLPAALLLRDWPAARRLVPPSGVALYLGITLSWFGLFAGRVGWDAATGIAVHQTVERYVDAWNGRHPVWYYLWQFPAGFLPWSLFLPWAAREAFASEAGSARRRAAIFLTVWIAAILLFFSFSTGKRGVYIIPLYPAASLLVGRLLARATDEGSDAKVRRGWRGLAAPLLLWCGLSGVLAIGLPFLAARRLPDLARPAAALGAVLFAGALVALAAYRRGRAWGAAVPLVLSMSVATIVAVERVVPWIDRHENLRGFAQEVRTHLEPGVPFATTEQKREAWVFYIGRSAEETDRREQILAYLAGGAPRDLLIEERLLEEIRDALPQGVATLLRGRVAGQDYYLLRRMPAP